MLSKETKGIFINTFRSIDDEDYEQGLYQISVQPYVRWSSSFAEPDASVPRQVESFVYQGPCLVDILAVSGATLESRQHWHAWETSSSDIEGCIRMHSPSILRPGMPLSDPKVAILCLVDELAGEGYTGVPRKVTHFVGGPKEYDDCKLLAKRKYLQCALALADLGRAGVRGFHSGHSDAYYAVLLRTKQLPLPGLSAKEYSRQLARVTGDVVMSCMLDRAPRPPPVAPREPVLEEALLDEVAGDEVGGGPAHDAGAAGELEDAVVDHEVAGDEGVPEPREFVADVPREILGQHVMRIKGRSHSGWSYNDRIGVRCSNKTHRTCTKSRSLALGVDVFGPRAAEIFLATWLSHGHKPEKEHREYLPSVADMRAYLACEDA